MGKAVITKLTTLRDKVTEAERALRTELAKTFPVGHTIIVKLNSRQLVGSTMEVRGYDGRGHVRAVMPSRKHHGTEWFARDVYFEDILDCYEVQP